MTSELSSASYFVDDFVSRYCDGGGGPFPLSNAPEELRISDGDDSEIYLIPETDQVMKFYVRTRRESIVTHEQLLFYRNITNKASSIALKNDWNVTFENSGVNVKVRINPYDELIESKKLGRLVGICPFIKGPNLLDDTAIKLKYGLPPYEIHNWLSTINSQIEEATRVEGVDVFLMNMKLISEETGLTLMITDLCKTISTLKPALLT